MAEPLVLIAVDARGVATLTLNRPEVHNAYNGAMIDALSEAVGALAADPRVRLLVLRANGKHFQAGADLAWLREVAGYALEDNVAFSRRTTLPCARSTPSPPHARSGPRRLLRRRGRHGRVLRHRARDRLGALCARRGALGRDPGADRAAAVRGMGVRSLRRYGSPASASMPPRRSASASCTKCAPTTRWTSPPRRSSRRSCGARRMRCATPSG